MKGGIGGGHGGCFLSRVMAGDAGWEVERTPVGAGPMMASADARKSRSLSCAAVCPGARATASSYSVAAGRCCTT